MKQAIQKAIEGGWKYKGADIVEAKPLDGDYLWFEDSVHTNWQNIRVEQLWCDPLFWQALVRGLDLAKKRHIGVWHTWNERVRGMAVKDEAIYQNERFMRGLYDGGNAESFFNELLK